MNQGTIVNATTGTGTEPGATRTGTIGNTTFHETLAMYEASPSMLTMSYYGIPGIYVVPSADPQGGKSQTLVMQSYAETVRFQSICAHSATAADISIVLCVNDLPLAYDSMDKLHRGGFDTLGSILNANTFPGGCLAALASSTYHESQ
ncbi:hypothetical protein DFH06DRAFT_1216207 [Mycena polygramma]|nr:hypothetical protein DFH06DRAFT_1216207 [Mycena polygramma]